MSKLFWETYKKVREAEKKQKKVDKMLAMPLRVDILRDIVNSAAHGVVIDLMFADGTKLVIRREDSFEQYKQKFQENF